MLKNLRRMGPYLRRYRRGYLLGLACVAVSTGFSIVTPLLIKSAIDALDKRLTREFILYSAGAIVCFAVLRAAFQFTGRYRLITLSRRIEYDLRNDLYRRLQGFPAHFYDRHKTGDILSRVINDIEAVRMVVGVGIMAITGTLLTFVFSAVMLFVLDPALAAMALVPLTLISLVMTRTGGKMTESSLAVQDQLGVLSTAAQENFSGARVIKAFACEDREIEHYRTLCRDYHRKNMTAAHWRGVTWALILVLTEACMAVTLLYGGRGIIEQRLTKGAFAAFTAYQFLLIWPMIAIGWVITLVQRGEACMGRLIKLLEAHHDSTVHADGPISGVPRIEFRNLVFQYEEGRPPAIRNVSFTIEGGRRVALIGRIGSGKSTLLHLLLKLYPTPRGMIFIDGRDINDIRTETIRQTFGCAPQDSFLFSDRIRENIAFGSLDGTTEEKILQAIRLARLTDDISAFPDKLDQIIGERGVTLSGGQKQRTSIARALLREPKVLLIDDAFSNVDAETERDIVVGILDHLGSRTLIAATHRLNSVRTFDEIIVLDEGRIIDRGPHAGLLERGGMYAHMLEQQSLEEILKRA